MCLKRKYTISQRFFGRKSVLMVSGKESQYRSARRDERGRIEGIVSGGGEDINPPPLPLPMIQHP